MSQSNACPNLDILYQALANYDMIESEWDFIGTSENIIYRVKYKSGTYCYRIHSCASNIDVSLYESDLHSYDSLNDEMRILRLYSRRFNFLSGGKSFQMPLKNKYNQYVSMIRGIPITVLTWINGVDFKDAKDTADESIIEIGKAVGVLHQISKSTKQISFKNRMRYDKNFFNNIMEKITIAYRNGIYSPSQYNAMNSAGKEVLLRMQELDKIEHMKGLIHGDLTKSNLLLQNGSVVPIDFGLCGYGYYYDDLGGLFLNFPTLCEQELISQGYYETTGITISKRYLHAFEVYHTLLYLATNGISEQNISWLPDDLFDNKNFVF